MLTWLGGVTSALTALEAAMEGSLDSHLPCLGTLPLYRTPILGSSYPALPTLGMHACSLASGEGTIVKYLSYGYGYYTLHGLSGRVDTRRDMIAPR